MRLVLSVYPFIDVESSREVKSVTQSHTASAGLSLDVILSGACFEHYTIPPCGVGQKERP